MRITTGAPFTKMVHKRSTVFRLKGKTPCVAARSDTKEFLSATGEWTDDMDNAEISTVSELFEKVKDLECRNKITFYFLKL